MSNSDTILKTQAIGTFNPATSTQLCNRFPSGTATGATGTTLTDTTSGGVPGGWITNEYAAVSVTILGGSGFPQTGADRTITSNTGTVLTVAPAFASVNGPVDATSRYRINVSPFGPNCTEPITGAHPLDTVSDVTTKLAIPLGNYNFSAIATTIPGSAFVAAGPGHPSFVSGTGCTGGLTANCPQLGDVMGALSSSSSLGLANGACSTATPVPFAFINATVDNSPGNLWDPQQAADAGTYGALQTYQSDDGVALLPTPAVADADPATDGRDNDNDAATDEADENLAANGLAISVDRYPTYLDAVFDPDFKNYGPDFEPYTPDDDRGPLPPVQPLARYMGSAWVAGSSIQLDLLIFAPGALAAAFAAPHPFADLTAEVGYTTATVLQNPKAQPINGSAITDFCSSVDTITTVWGEARSNPCNGAPGLCNATDKIFNPLSQGALTNNGLDRMRTPAAAGNYAYVSYGASLRDTDGDGYENPLDTCPYAVNVDNPRAGTGADLDQLDPVCDTDDILGDSNVDGDSSPNGTQWLNAGDNCPQISNSDGAEEELNHLYGEAFATNPGPQGGPQTDSIGDACDVDDVRANGDYLTKLQVTSKCHGGTDADDDGYCTASVAPAVLAFDPNDAAGAVTPEDYDMVYTFGVSHAGAGDNPPERQPVQVCNDGIDNDGDTLIDNLDAAAGNSTCRPANQLLHPGFPTCAATGCTADSDGDGSTDEAERHTGTNPLGRCGVAGGAPSPEWTADFATGSVPNSTDRINVLDLSSFIAPDRHLDTAPGNALFNVRWDVKPGPDFGANWIHVPDLGALIAGSTGFPPMFSGVKAFGGPVCTAHPVFGR